MKKLGFLITGRMKSTRLKEKLTLPLNNVEVIVQMIRRAKLVIEPCNIIIATSKNPQDDILMELANREGVKCFRGHEEDVIARLHAAAIDNELEYFINITADCPLFGYDYLEMIYNLLLDEKADLVTSLDLPHGIFTYGIRTSALSKIIEIKKTENTEVWGDYFYNNTETFKVVKLPVEEEEQRKYRLTLDYPEDYEFFKKIYDHFGELTYRQTSKEIITFLDSQPKIVDINKNVAELYKKRWEAQRVSKIEKNLPAKKHLK